MDRVTAYVDGSYEHAIGTYAYGCVVFTPEGQAYRKSGRGNNPDTAKIRNIAGEMLAAMTSVQWAMKHGYPAIEIRYDYMGIEKWATGEWKAKNELTGKYAATMQRWGSIIRISFTKVKAHTGNTYNEMADELARGALTGEEIDWELFDPGTDNMLN